MASAFCAEQKMRRQGSIFGFSRYKRRHTLVSPKQTGTKLPSIAPFIGVIYNQEKVKDLSSVVSPPYDIIPKIKQDELYRKNPYNFVRLELNKIKAADNSKDNRYTRAKEIFDSWLNDRILVKNGRESFYIYSQNYKKSGLPIEQIGFIGLMALDEKLADKVLPHENILAAPKADRLNLIRNVKACLSPIFVLYEDRKHKITQVLKNASSKNRPFIDINVDNVRHRAWRMNDDGRIRQIEGLMRGKDIFIADGHHRYETSRAYCSEIRKDKDAPEGLKSSCGYIMAYFVESDDRMLTILPAHRVVKDTGALKKRDILDRLGKYFHIEQASGINRLISTLGKTSDKHVFGMYLGKGEFYIMTLKKVEESDKAIKSKPEVWKRLDVAILHLFIFRHVLSIKDEDDNIEFLKDPEDAVSLVDGCKGRAVFFLKATKVSQVKRIARLGERMPRKATYFYPKPLSGLVVNKLG